MFNPHVRAIEELVAEIPYAVKKEYPVHIFEPIRIEIARELVVKECYKLLPFLSEREFDTLHETMADWLIGKVPDLTPIHDFWNVLEGIVVSLKGKDIIAQVTSEHMRWELEHIDAADVSLYWPIDGLHKLGQPPYSYSAVKRSILNHPAKRAVELQASDGYAANTHIPRDHFPIIVRRNADKGLQLLDGNRRTFRAWLQGRTTLLAWVGTVTETPTLHNHWINKGFLRRLVAEYSNNPTKQMKNLTRRQLKQIFASSEIARLQYQKYCVPYNTLASELIEGLF